MIEKEFAHIDSDLALRPSEEAKICLFCDKKKCSYNCKRLRTKLKELREKEREDKVRNNGT